MKKFSNSADKSLDFFFSAIGFRDPLVDDDRAVRPHVKKGLQDTSYKDMEIGERNSDRNWEHAVRYLGDNYVIKYVSPEDGGVMEQWVGRLRKQKDLLEKYLGKFLPNFGYFLVPLVDNKAIYFVVMERIKGRPLLKVDQEELFSSPVRGNLLAFFQANSRLRREQGIFADLVGGRAINLLDPRYTGNLWITKEGQVRLVDTVLIPRKFDPATVPAKYRTCGIYHFAYRYLVLPHEQRFVERLQSGVTL